MKVEIRLTSFQTMFTLTTKSTIPSCKASLTTQNKLKIIDICCGMGSLVDPWYKNDHDITLIELNEKLIPFLILPES